MNENFIAAETIDEFQSAIWTERYWAAGEAQLIVPATPYFLEVLREGTYLGLTGTKEVMQLKTDSIENGLLTVSGTTLPELLDDRIHWPKSTDPVQPIADYTVDSARVGELLPDRVDKMVINPVPFPGGVAPWNKLNLDWVRDKIDHLELGAIDHGGELQRLTVPVGPLYSVLQPLAEKDGLGFTLYLDFADAELGYTLKFMTYRGADHTSANPDPNKLIRLTPNMETLNDLKEVRSIDGYKNVVYVVYKNEISVHYEDPNNIPEGLDRRVMILDAEGEPIGTQQDARAAVLATRDWYGGMYQNTTVVGAADILKFREQNAKDALANHNYIRALDGQVSQNNEYVFGEHYGMGDILELEGLTGVINKARVTEFIRAQDSTGYREYPTLSVIT